MKLNQNVLYFFIVAICLQLHLNVCQNVEKTDKELKNLPYEGGNIKVTENNNLPSADNSPDAKEVQKSESKKKELKLQEPVQNPDEEIRKTEGKTEIISNKTNFKSLMTENFDISGSTGISAVLFVSSLLVVFFIMYRTCRMKQSRGERRYGGVPTSYQELSPITIEDDDSETEEQALFDINKARASQVVL